MKQIAPEHKLILFIAPVRKGRPQQSVAEGKAFPLIIVLFYLYLEKIAGGAAGAAVQGIGGIGGVFLKTGVSVATSATNTVASKAIQYAGDWDGFASSMSSFDTWSGVITSGAGALVTNSLGEMNLGTKVEKLTGKDGKTILNTIQTKVDGFNSSQIGSIQSFNSLAGGLATSALSYGLTGEATFNVLNISNFGAGASCGLLEVSVGNNGVKTRLGTGGTDVSVGTLLSAISGIKNLGMNEKIKKAAQENNMAQSATALRMLYGFGDDKGLELLDDVLNKKVSLAAGSGPENAQTILENGKRTVYLNGYSNDMTREEQLKLGITLGHEAYRDGVKGSLENQMAETFSAVAGHTAMIKRVQNDSLYSSVMTGIIESDMNLKNDVTRFDYALKNNDWSSFGEYVLGNYDYSADYWKLKTDGTIVWDDSKDLNAEYYDENGQLQESKVVKANEESTYAGTLAEYVGVERAEQILAASGKNINDAGSYSKTALMDVLGVSDEVATQMQHTGSLPLKMTAEQEQRLIGEALMANGGMTWDGVSRGNKTGFSISMSDHDIGQIVINPIFDNFGKITGYDRFGITGEVLRDERSYSSSRNIASDGYKIDGNQGLDSIYLYKKDLNGNILDSTIYDSFSQGWQTVANGYADPNMNIQAYPSFNILDGLTDNIYRGSTVTDAQDFYIRFGNFTASDNHFFEGNYFVINREQTLLEGIADSAGRTCSSPLRNLGHSNFLKSTKTVPYPHVDLGGLISAGCFVNTQHNVNYMNAWVMNNVPYSYDIKTIIRQKYSVRR